MSAQFPLFIIIIDYLLGMIMWTLIGRFGMSIFMHETSDFFFMKVFVKFTNPVIFLFRPVTPGFLLDKLHPLYVAWFLYDQILCCAVADGLQRDGGPVVPA